MRDRGLDRAERPPALEHGADVGHVDWPQPGVKPGQDLGRCLGQLDHFGVGAGAVEAGIDPNTEAARAEHALAPRPAR